MKFKSVELRCWAEGGELIRTRIVIGMMESEFSKVLGERACSRNLKLAKTYWIGTIHAKEKGFLLPLLQTRTLF